MNPERVNAAINYATAYRNFRKFYPQLDEGTLLSVAEDISAAYTCNPGVKAKKAETHAAQEAQIEAIQTEAKVQRKKDPIRRTWETIYQVFSNEEFKTASVAMALNMSSGKITPYMKMFKDRGLIESVKTDKTGTNVWKVTAEGRVTFSF